MFLVQKKYIVAVPALLSLMLLLGCGSAKQEASPLDALKSYGNAFKKKDYPSMKLLLSDASLKMTEQEAKAQGSTVDDVLQRETLFTDAQRSAEFRNLKIEDSKATVDMKDSLGMWTTVYFVKEDGEWKIDKKGFADELLRQSEEDSKRLDEMINANR